MAIANTYWFNIWFNSPYYHILYKNRDEIEAKKLIDKLIDYLSIKTTDKLLDLACGKGRHAIYLNSKGFNIEGIDLSKDNIRSARQFSNKRLHFNRHDMREVYKINTFNCVLNMFTSFGYFDTEYENIQVVQAVAKALKKKGRFVLDFFNTQRLINKLEPVNTFGIKNMIFNIKRFIDGSHIVKNIEVNDRGKVFHFYEKVMMLEKKHFLNYANKAKLDMIEIFGDYELNPYQSNLSERMIFIFEKP